QASWRHHKGHERCGAPWVWATLMPPRITKPPLDVEDSGLAKVSYIGENAQGIDREALEEAKRRIAAGEDPEAEGGPLSRRVRGWRWVEAPASPRSRCLVPQAKLSNTSFT